MIHANDVRYDAYLANDRTLADPEVVRVEKGGRVRLRIINGATATSFHIASPGLATEVVAVDGVPCQPLRAARYPLAQGQRIDLVATIPKEGGAFALLAQVEDALFQTGIVLATAGARVKRIRGRTTAKARLLDLSLDNRLAAQAPLPVRRADRTVPMVLGEAAGYRWTINGRIHGEHEPLAVRHGERVEMQFMNPTGMMHPMHLHGHHFQVVDINGQAISGALRDTVLVPAMAMVTVAFEADNPGRWLYHCHNLYHMATGMMSELVYV